MDLFNNMQNIQLPSSKETDQAVAGLCLNYPSEIVPRLNTLMFDAMWMTDELSRDIVITCSERLGKGSHVDFVSILNSLRISRPWLEPHILTDISMAGAIPSALDSWVDIIKSTYQRRKSILMTQDALKELQGTTPTTQLLEKLRTDIQSLFRSSALRQIKTWGQMLYDQSIVWENGRDESKIVKTGIKQLDDIMVLDSGDMLVLGGGTGSGKTMLALNMVSNIMSNSPKGAGIIFTLEMTASQVLNRMISNLSNVPVERLKMGKLGERSFTLAVEAANTTKDWPFTIRDDCHELNQIMAISRSVHATKGLSVVMVDYLQLVKNSDRELREQQVADVSRNLRLLGIETGALIIAVIQLNSQGESRESKQILMDATQVITVRLIDEDGTSILKMDDSVTLDNTKRRIEIGKQRDGIVGEHVDLQFNGATSSFR